MRFFTPSLAALALSVAGLLGPLSAVAAAPDQTVLDSETVDTASFEPPAVFEVLNYTETFDFTASYIKKSSIITIKNIASSAQGAFFVTVADNDQQRLALIEGKTDGPNERPLRVDPPVLSNKAKGVHFFRVVFPEMIAPGESFTFWLAQALVDKVKPLPEYANQNDHQILVYEGTKYPMCAYPMESGAVRVRIQDSEFNKDITGDGDDKLTKDKGLVVFGPYHDIEPYSTKPLRFRFENPRPLVAVTKLDRDIWVSHSGNTISFDETYWLKNIGTKIKSFSRLDYSGPHTKYDLNVAALRALVYHLPLGAREIYYTDLVGNVSTSKFYPSTRDVALEIKPRYPLFGGWTYNYTIGWSNDLKNYLKELEKDQYILRVPLIEGPDTMPYSNVTVRVILPQGADNIELLPLAGATIDETYTFSYLDSKGRPTIEFRYNTMVDAFRISNIYITYSYTMLESLRKPLTLSATFFAAFILYLVISKVDLEIVKPSSKTKAEK